MIIGFYETEQWEEALLKKAFAEDELVFVPTAVGPNALPERKDLEILCIFVQSRLTEEVLRELPNLRAITTRSTGFDHIDVSAAKARGIKVMYVPGYGDNTVAEMAFGLLLNLTRKIYLSIDRIKETGSFALDGLRGTDLKGKTIGVVGTGRIGREAIRIAKGFGMDVIAYDVMPNPSLPPELGFKYVSMDELLSQSDVVTLHCPYTPETKHIISSKNIGRIKRGAYLINTARGGLVETESLVKALQDGILSGAGLDVLEEEGEMQDELKTIFQGHPQEEELKTMLQNHVLMKMPNVLITPHNAFNSDGALQRILNTTIDNIGSHKKGVATNLVPGQ
ncbi:MAG: hydroxyacid dehydrogenase [Candidatus Liptonbacteria bacterium]